MRGLFVTGTDTGVGKTMIASSILRLLVRQDIEVTVRKPVESGCPVRGNNLFPEDAQSLKQAAQSSEALDVVCPYRFQAAVAPPRSAKLEGVNLTFEMLTRACDFEPSKFLVVEGAGGFYSPIAVDGLNADLAEFLQFPVIIVAADRLGTINQILLVLEAVKNRGLTPLCVIVNGNHSCSDLALNNREDLLHWTNTPVLKTPFLSPLSTTQRLDAALTPVLALIDHHFST